MANWSEKFNKVTQSAINKSKEVAEMTRLNINIGSLNQNIKDIYTKAGEYVLKNGLLGEDEIIAGYSTEVETLQQSILADKEKLREIKNVDVCQNCGANVSRDSKYCDKCGAEVVRPTQETQE